MRTAWTLEASGVFVACASMILSVMDFGAHVDGPGIGYLEGPQGMIVFGGAALVGAVVAVLAHGRATQRLGWLVGLAACAVFLLASAPSRLLRLKWAHDCASGSGRACYAYGNVYGYEALGGPADAARARGLYVRACELGDPSGCREAKELGAVSHEEGCVSMRAACARQVRWSCIGARECNAPPSPSDGGPSPPLP